jgi:hypothetical protein
MALDVGRLVAHLRTGAEPEIAVDGEDWVNFCKPEGPPAGEVWLSIRTTRKWGPSPPCGAPDA